MTTKVGVYDLEMPDPDSSDDGLPHGAAAAARTERSSNEESGDAAGDEGDKTGLHLLIGALTSKIDQLQISSERSAAKSDEALHRLTNLESKRAADVSSTADVLPGISATRVGRGDQITSQDGLKSSIRSLPESSMRVPKLGTRADFRDALTDVSNWHDIVTQDGYRNSISTAEAIRQFISENPVEPGHGASLEVFRRAVYKQILSHPISSSSPHGKSNTLFQEFKTIWITFLLPSEFREKHDAFKAVFGSVRKSGTPILSSMELFRQNVTKLCELLDTHGDEGVHEVIPVPLFNLALVNFLHLNDSAFNEFKRRLQEHLAQNLGHLALLQFMQQNAEIDDLLLDRRAGHRSRNFLANAPSDKSEDSCGTSQANELEILPAGFNGTRGGSHESSGVDAFVHQTEKEFFKAKQCFLGKNAHLYSPDKLYSMYLGSKKADGINRFPKNWRSGSGHNRKDRALFGAKLAKKLGVNCSRCFRESCTGSSSGWKDAPCSQKGSEEFVSYEFCIALFHLLKFFFHTDNPKHIDSAKIMVNNFFASEGLRLTSDSSVEQVKTFLLSQMSYYSQQPQQAVFPPSTIFVTTNIPLYAKISYHSQRSNSASSEMLDRALKAMPDIGCPEYIAGDCWWRDYASILRDAHLLETVTAGKAPGTYAFGDHEPRPALFRLIQVPLFYSLQEGRSVSLLNASSHDTETIVVFANITIVSNEVGLLNGKFDMAAMRMEVQLDPEKDRSQFSLLGRRINVLDTDSHFFLQLGQPRCFGAEDVGFSIRRKSNGRAKVVEVNAANHHAQRKLSFDPMLEVLSYDPHMDMLTVSESSFNVSLTEQSGSEDRIPMGVIGYALSDDCRSLDSEDEYCLNSELEQESCEKRVCQQPAQRSEISENDGHHKCEGLQQISELLSVTEPTLDISDSESRISINAIECPQKTSFARDLKTGVMTSSEIAEMKGRLRKLHISFNHPSSAQLLVVLQNSLPVGTLLHEDITKAVLSLNCESCAINRRHQIEPSRPAVAIPRALAPGQIAHIDTGHFQSPRGSFAGFVHVDSFSLYVSTDTFESAHPTGPDAIRAHLNAVMEIYEETWLDLGSCFDSAVFKDFLEKIGTQFMFVPTGAHWASRAEKTIDLLKVELAAVFTTFPDMECRNALKLAALHLNRRRMTTYKMSRAALHLGRREPLAKMGDQLFSLACPSFGGSLEDVDNFIDKASGNRTEKVQREAELRIKKALSERLSSKEPLQLCNGDAILIFHKGVSRATTGYRGPFTVLGQVRGLVLAFRGRHVVTSHISRVLLHRRGPHSLPLQVQEGGTLPPPTRNEVNDALESPITLDLAWDHQPTLQKEPTLLPVQLEAGIQEKTEENVIQESPMIDLSLTPAESEDKHADALVDSSSYNPEILPLPLDNQLLDPAMKIDDNVDKLSSLGRPEDLNIDEILPFETAIDTSQTLGKRRAEDADLVELLDNNKEVKKTRHFASSQQISCKKTAQCPLDVRSFDYSVLDLSESPLVDSNFQSDELTLPSMEQSKSTIVPTAHKEVDSSLSFISSVKSESAVLKNEYMTDKALAVDVTFESPDSRESAHAHARDLKQRLRTAKEKARSGFSMKRSSFPHPGLPTISKECVFDRGNTYSEQESIVVFNVTSRGIGLERIYAIDKSRKRTVVLEYQEAIKMPEFKKAMNLEIETFKKFDALEEVKLTDLSAKDSNLVTTRWVLTLKTKEDGTKKAKARLVARGFEDLEKDVISRDSPTASNASQRLVLQVLAQNQWVPQSWDFLSAFLQGKWLDRSVIIAPPDEFGVPEGTVWRIKKPIYGLVSAPKAWYDALFEICEEEGLDSEVSDEGVMRLRKNGEIVGILAIHVDDAIGGGTSELNRVMSKVGERLQIGAHSSADTLEDGAFYYKGLKIQTIWKQNDRINGSFEIVLDGNEYLDAVLPMKVPSGENESRLDAEQMTEFRSVAGCLGYMATSFRPELSVEGSILGRHFMSPSIASAKKANAALQFAKENRTVLRFRPGVAKLLVFTDSAGPDEKGTQGGRIFCGSDVNGEAIAGFWHWESRKVKRTCKSSTTGEILSACEALDGAIWLRQLWQELTGELLPVEIVTDSSCTAKNSVTTKLPKEKRNRIDLAILRQSLKRGEYVLTWVPGKANLADPLTKETAHGKDCIRPNMQMKRLLLNSIISMNSHLKGVPRVSKSKEDVSKY